MESREFTANLVLAYSDNERSKVRILHDEETSDEHTDPFLYLGPYYAAELDLDLLKQKQITHILNVTCEIETIHKNNLKTLQISIDDAPNVAIDEHFTEALTFIKGCLEEKGCILVHCQAGVSRSSTMVLSFLLEHLRMNLSQSLTYLKKRRNVISPNMGFIRRLHTFELSLFGTSDFAMADYCADWIYDFLPVRSKDEIKQLLITHDNDVDDVLDILLA